MKKIFTPLIHRYILQIYKGRNNYQIRDMVNEKFDTNFSYEQIKNYKNRYNLKSGIHYSGADRRPKLFTDEILDFIKANVKGLYNKELAELVNKKFGTEYSAGQIERIKIRLHVVSGLTGQFEKGQIPPNKGKKMSKEVYEKASKTMFKKGHLPKNHKPVGSERVDAEGYYWIKIAEPRTWKMRHVYEYEKVYGPLNKGEIVIFADGNKANFNIENLIKITRSELLSLNRYRKISEFGNVTKANLATIRLKKTLKEKRKKQNEV